MKCRSSHRQCKRPLIMKEQESDWQLGPNELRVLTNRYPGARQVYRTWTQNRFPGETSNMWGKEPKTRHRLKSCKRLVRKTLGFKVGNAKKFVKKKAKERSILFLFKIFMFTFTSEHLTNLDKHREWQPCMFLPRKIKHVNIFLCPLQTLF